MSGEPDEFDQRRERLSSAKKELLARRLEGKGATKKREEFIPKRTSDGPLPLSMSQQSLFYLEQISPGLATYNIPLAYNLRGPINGELLQACFDKVVIRHEVLRTRIVSTDGTLSQIIDDSKSGRLELVNLCELPGDQRASRALELATEQARRPIDFSNGPVFNASLYRKSESEHLLVIVVHHIAFDGWSAGILLNELASIYGALSVNTKPTLDPIAIQYADYALWQRNRAQSGAFERDLAYWRTQLQKEPPQLGYLSVKTATDDAIQRGSVVYDRLARGVVDRLSEFCLSQHRTLFTVLLSVWKTLLFRISGHNDILVGSAVAGRLRPELEPLLGYFVNMVVLRTEVSGDLTFLKLLERVHAVAIEAQDHQELPFEALVQDLKPNRVRGQIPLIETVFQVQNTPFAEIEIPGVCISNENIHSGTAKFPLMLIVSEENNELCMTLEFSTAMLDEDRARAILDHYAHLLEQILANPSATLDSLDLLQAREQDQILNTWNNTGTKYPRNECVHHLLEEQAKTRPHATALNFLGRDTSYQELNEQANQLAHFLLERGLAPECFAATYLDRSVAQIVALLATLKAGGAYVPLDRSAPKERLKRVLADTGTRILLTTSDLENQLPDDFDGVICLDNIAAELAKRPKDNLTHVKVHARNLAYVMYTSGSSGTPKGVCIEHRSIVRLVRNTNYVDFSPDHVFLQFAPVSFDASTFEIWGSLLNGAKLVIYPPDFASLKEFGEFLRSERITTLWLTAGLFHRMVEGHLDALSGLQQLLAGGDVLSATCARRVLKAFPQCRLINGYGPTESTTFACCHTLALEDLDNFVPIGAPISNTRAYVLDPRGKPLPVGIAGELYLGGDGVARGYLNRPDETRERFIPDPFQTAEDERMYRTGDLVEWLPGGILKFLGRMDDQVKVRGFRVELREIEFALEQHPGVVESAVLIRGDRPELNRLVACVVPAANRIINLTEVRRYLGETLPDYMLPSALVSIQELPLNSNGKVDRVALLGYFLEETTEPALDSDVAPKYLPLVALWKRLLAVERVGLDDNFFDLGGHSLLALEMVDALQEEFSVRISLRSFLEHPTINQLATLLENERMDEELALSHDSVLDVHKNLLPTAIPLRPTGSKTPFFFICGAADVAEAYGRLASHMSPDQPFYGIQESLQSLETGAIYSVEELADQFIASMRAIQPNGPYSIGGWSFGGIVAFQMAQRLLQLGERIHCLVLVDCEARPMSVCWHQRSSRDNFEYLARHAHGLLRGIKQRTQLIWCSLPLFPEYAREILQITRSSVASTSGSSRNDLRIREYLQWAREDMQENFEFTLAVKRGTTTHRSRLSYTQDPYVRTLHRVISRRRFVMESYSTMPFSGRIVLVRASQAPLVWRFSDKALGWDKVAKGGMRLKVIPGDHMSIIREPHVRGLAEALQESLDEAETT